VSGAQKRKHPQPGRCGQGSVVAQQKPNILIIWGDDIGSFNLDRVMEAVTKPHGGSN